MKKTNKVEFLERQFHSKKLSFVHKKESEHSFELSLSTCVFYQRILNLEMQKFSLENHHMMNARQPFSWRMTSTLPSLSPSRSICFGDVSEANGRETPSHFRMDHVARNALAAQKNED